MMRMMGLLCAASALLWTGTAHADKLSAADQTRWDAALALYGHGLDIKRTKKTTTIAPAKKKPLTQERWNEYVENHYLPALRIITYKRQGTAFRWAEDYSDQIWDPRAATKRAHILLEPKFKYNLCREIVRTLEGVNPVAKADYRAVCITEAINEAFSNMVEYRGQKVTWDNQRDRGDLALDAEIWAKDASGNYAMVLTLAGGREIISQPGMTITETILDDLADHAKNYKKAWAQFLKRKKGYQKMLKAAAAKQKKLAGGKIAFSSQQFLNWEARPNEKGPLECRSAHYLAYAPTKKTKLGYFEQVFVDGQVCDGHPLGAGDLSRDNLAWIKSCYEGLKPGTHTLEVSVHHMIIDATWNEKRLNKKLEVVNVKQERGAPGKKLYSAKVECTMK